MLRRKKKACELHLMCCCLCRCCLCCCCLCCAAAFAAAAGSQVALSNSIISSSSMRLGRRLKRLGRSSMHITARRLRLGRSNACIYNGLAADLAAWPQQPAWPQIYLYNGLAAAACGMAADFWPQTYGLAANPFSAQESFFTFHNDYTCRQTN